MFHKFRFKTKMILAQNIIILFVVIILGSIYYHKVMSTMSENMQEDFKIVSDIIVNQLDNHFYVLDKTAVQIAANPDIVDMFRKLSTSSEENYFQQEPLANAEVVRLLNSYNFKRDGVKRICLYNQQNDFVYTATDITTNSGIAQWFSSESFRNVQEFFQKENRHVYYTWYKNDILNDTGSSEEPYFSVVRQIKNYITNEQVYAYVEVQEDVKWLDRAVESVGEDTYVVLLDKKNLIYESLPVKRNPEKRSYQEIISAIMESSQEETMLDVSGCFVYAKRLSYAPYQIVFIKEKGRDLSFFNQYNMAILISIFLILLTAVATEIFIVKRLSRPLEQLNESVSRMTLDHPQMELGQWQDNDEFVRLQWAFQAMIERMKVALEREYASETNEIKAQLFALQSQMNPHFLYNILAIISIEAQGYGDDKIPNVCMRLRRMLVYGSHMGDGYSQIKDEMDYVLDYMELMKERYEELFQYEMEVDEQLCRIKIPKYIIQPICENSFKHSFKNMEPVWKIKISILKKDGKWMIEIRDNGGGFPAKYLEEFERRKEEFSFHQVRNKLGDSRIEGMGIWNIYMRLMICYDNDFVFRLYNDEGAVVVIGGRLDD